MRLSLWVVPTIAFVAAAAAIVQREAEPTADSTTATVAEPATIDEAPAQALPAVPSIVIDQADPLQLAPPAGRGLEPAWKIIDHVQTGEILSPSDVPVLAISNAKPVDSTEVAAKNSAGKGNSATSSNWEVIGHSVGGRPIHVRRFGSSGDITLIICGMDGEDRIAVKWIDRLSQQLADAPEQADGRQIILVRDPNPDGLTTKQSANEHGVLINQNFPTMRYRPGATSGSGPASEPETRAVLEALYKYPPKRVIHVLSAGKSEVAANSAAQPLVEMLRQGRNLTSPTEAATPAAGSIEEFATVAFQAEVLTLQLATGDDWRSAAVEHFPTLMAAAVPKIGHEAMAVAQLSSARSSAPAAADADTAPSPFSSGGEIVPLDRQGYEELPPPPQKPSW